MKKNYVLLAVVLFSMLIIVGNVSAFMPKYTHKYIQATALKDPINSEFYNACIKYPELCYAGNVLSDVAVIYYYTGRGVYASTHSPAFCQKLIENTVKIPGADVEKMRACAIGGCMHQPADIPSHSQLPGGQDGLVTYAIKHSLLVNQIIHVFAEQKVDNYMARTHPLEGVEADQYLASYTTLNECQDLFLTTMSGQTGIDRATLQNDFVGFIAEIINSQSTGYDVAFEKKSFLGTIDVIPFPLLAAYILFMLTFLVIIILDVVKIIKRESKIRHYVALIIFVPLFIVMAWLFVSAVQGKAFSSFITLIKPMSELVPIGNPDTYVDAAIVNTRQLLTQGEGWLTGTDASGMATNPVLDIANNSIMWVDYLIIIGLTVFLIWFVWYLFKSNKVSRSEIGGMF